MTNKKSVKRNYIYNMLYQLLLILLPIITTPYIARKLGAAGNGIYGYTISIVTYFILFGSLGINLYGQREIAYNQKNIENRSKTFVELIILKTITMSLAAVIFYFFFCQKGEYSVYYKILLIEMLANVIDISWFYQGLEDFKKIVLRNFVIKLISLICIFVFIKGPTDINKYLFIHVCSTLFGGLTLWFGLNKYFSVKLKKLNITRHLPMIMALFIPQVAIQIYTVLDKTMIGAILHDMNEVGYYEQSQRIIKILLTIITAVGTVMLPRLANCFAEKNYEQIKKYMYKTFSFVFMLSFPLMLGIIVVANNFAPLFFGKGYDKVPAIMQMLSPIVLFISISNITGTQYLISTKRQKEFTISVVVGAVVNFLLNLVFIYFYKSVGAAIATVIAELSVTLVQLYFVRKDFKLLEIVKLSKNYIIASILMFGICYAIDFFIAERLLGLVLQVACGGLSYLTILLVLKDKFLFDTYDETIKPILKRKQN